MVLPLVMAATLPKQTVMLLAVGSGLLVGVVIFLVLFLRSRPPAPIQRVAVVKGSAAGQGVAIVGKVRIGRDPSNDLAIDDEELSRFHCEISNDSGVTILQDMRSANGTRVNGRDVMSSVLKSGDEISIGSQLLRCS